MKKSPKNKKVTVSTDELAIMVQKGFDNSSAELQEVKKDIEKRLDGIDTRLDHIENLLIRAHENRIEKLEEKVRELQTAIGK